VTLYPPAQDPVGAGIFTCAQLESGAIVLHIIGVLYTFYALAIVCDEFFVPALEGFVEDFQISDDVAGATFMAAGGSAPELFTSFIGTFITKSSVGFGTIVGSAVFNVLFVIGCCAIFSKELLSLTWWPLARDCSYYCLSLLVLAIFFGVVTPNEIDAWEAAVLLLLYVGYAVFMKHNQAINAWLCSKLNIATSGAVVDPVDSTKGEGGKKKEGFDGVADIENPLKKTNSEKRRVSVVQQDWAQREHAILTQPSRFRAGILKLAISEKSMLETAGVHVVSNIIGNVQDTFDEIADDEGKLGLEQLRELLEAFGHVPSEQELLDVMHKLDKNGDNTIEFDEFEEWYNVSEARMLAEMKLTFKRVDANGNNLIEKDELRKLLMDLGQKHDEETVAKAMKELDANGDGKVTEEEFYAWYQASMFWEKRKQDLSDAEEDRKTLYPTMPDDIQSRIVYILSFPLIFLLYSTIPDVQKSRLRKWYPVSFVLSILWIGIFSFFMVWWATNIGDVAGISPNVMGLTFLAAGTSVPDLLSSVIVAKQGKGDMAVSSSVGSNIFDVLVGLPLPWLCKALADGASVSVQAPSLFVSILILFGMVAVVIATIAYCEWKMTKTLGYTMFALYIIFVVQDLLRQ
jgi:K+-dependent Na+/Ca+ exchanger-like protein